MMCAVDAGPARLSWTEFGEGAIPAQRPAAPEAWGDVVLRGRDLAASYHLAVVVDDALQGVTDVVRGIGIAVVLEVHHRPRAPAVRGAREVDASGEDHVRIRG